MIVNYHIIDRQTGAIVGKAKTLRGARASVDRRDNAYGGYRYYAKRVTPYECQESTAS